MAKQNNPDLPSVVDRIRFEIDFCFYGFYGKKNKGKRICDEEFTHWLNKGYHSPGQLTVYIKRLSGYLPNPTQRHLFINLARDCITIVKKRERAYQDRFKMRNRLMMVFALLIACGAVAVLLL